MNDLRCAKCGSQKLDLLEWDTEKDMVVTYKCESCGAMCEAAYKVTPVSNNVIE